MTGEWLDGSSPERNQLEAIASSWFRQSESIVSGFEIGGSQGTLRAGSAQEFIHNRLKNTAQLAKGRRLDRGPAALDALHQTMVDAIPPAVYRTEKAFIFNHRTILGEIGL